MCSAYNVSLQFASDAASKSLLVEKVHELMLEWTIVLYRLESLEGKRLAIDSSIWLYHFQMAMRDKEGRTLSNAHILGFLWRILKLIHYGIRPIFVFDGGAPVMKRQTLVNRRTRRQGAKDDHRKVAERLLNARMREAAITHVSGESGTGGGGKEKARQQEQSELGEAKGRQKAATHGLGEGTVYFDDLNSTMPVPESAAHVMGREASPARSRELRGESESFDVDEQRDTPATEAARKRNKRNDFHKDPYALPKLDQEISSLTADSSNASARGKGRNRRQDIRFATEGELRALLSSIGPTDLDMDSEFFRSLPPELQYELVGDLRAASRGTSYKRLQSMLAQSPTPIDFSRAQIAGLKTRNELTQKVLEVTDEIGDAHIKVPIRVAGARNKEYVLVKNQGKEGGFSLGVLDQGTSREKAIVVDEDDTGSIKSTTDDEGALLKLTDSEAEMEDVPVQVSPIKAFSAAHHMSASSTAALAQTRLSDAVARKKVARELLQRRAQELAKEKRREYGIEDEREKMEDQLRKHREAGDLSGPSRGLVANSREARELFLCEKSIDLDGNDENEDTGGEEDSREVFEKYEGDKDLALENDEMQDLATALDESSNSIQRYTGDCVAAVDSSIEGGTDEEDMQEVPMHAFEADDYTSFYTMTPKASLVASKEEPMALDQEMEDSAQSDPPPSVIKKTVKAIAESPESHSTIQRKHATCTRGENKILTSDVRSTQVDDQPQDVNSNFSVSKFPHLVELNKRSDPDLLPAKDLKIEGKRENTIVVKDIAASNECSDHSSGDQNVALHSPRAYTHGNKAVDSHCDARIGTAELPLALQVKEPAKSKVKLHEFARLASNASSEEEVHYGAASERRTGQRQVTRDERSNGSTSTKSTDKAEASLCSDEFVAKDKQGPQTATLYCTSVTEEQEMKQGARDPAALALPIEAKYGMQRRKVENADRSKGDLEVRQTDRPISLKFGQRKLPEACLDEEAGKLGGEDRDDASLPSPTADIDEDDEEAAEAPIEWSPSPSPEAVRAPMLGADGFPLPSAEELEALEVDDEAELGHMQDDQDEFVSFLSRAKGQGLHQIQREVQEEVDKLRGEYATTRRTEGDVTQQMAREIQLMLRLFGLPYITAPMEAEAQCAELVALRLADGVITDDSDVFLFGGTFVYKNMFNNKKYVECFKLSDLQHDLGMDRTKLVQLAYLLGSDYTEGLAGVGPVLAMEILSIFQGDDALVKFRQWWLKVQQGKDSNLDDTRGATMRRIKKSLRNKVTLDANWPDPNVLDAYYDPQVDVSREAFQWGLPDLDSLRSFFLEYLRWPNDRTDHYLLPAIEAQNRRSRARGNQSTLDRGNFFDLTAGMGVFAGRQRPKYGSNRLQQVVNNFRESNRESVSGKEGGLSKKYSTAEEGTSIRKPRASHEGKNGRGRDFEYETDEVIDDGQVPEELLGKEMGKRSRPIVRSVEGQLAIGVTGGSREEEQNKRDKQASRNLKSVEFESQATSVAKTGKRKKTGRDGEAIAKKRARKRRIPVAEGGTSIRTGRNMSLDDVDSLPPSRGQNISYNLVPQRVSAVRARQLINREEAAAREHQDEVDSLSSSADEYR